MSYLLVPKTAQDGHQAFLSLYSATAKRRWMPEDIWRLVCMLSSAGWDGAEELHGMAADVQRSRLPEGS